MNANSGAMESFEDQSSRNQPSNPGEALMRSLLSLLDATMRETWLPMGFRALVVQEFPRLRDALTLPRGFAVDELEHSMRLIEEQADAYRSFAKRSESFMALKALRAELQGQMLLT